MYPSTPGWIVKDDVLAPLWYEENTLPTDEEYDRHIQQKYQRDENEITESTPTNESSETTILRVITIQMSSLCLAPILVHLKIRMKTKAKQN